MWQREQSFTRTEYVARWSGEGRAAYEAERSSAVRFCFSTGARCSNEAGNNYIRGDVDFFFFFKFRFYVNQFAVLCRAVLSFSYIHGASGLFSWMEHGALGI